jgi:hypothetical protein
LLDDGWRTGFAEFSRRAGDFALAMCAAFLRFDDGRIVEARIGLGGATDRPSRIAAAEAPHGVLSTCSQRPTRPLGCVFIRKDAASTAGGAVRQPAATVPIGHFSRSPRYFWHRAPCGLGIHEIEPIALTSSPNSIAIFSVVPGGPSWTLLFMPSRSSAMVCSTWT